MEPEEYDYLGVVTPTTGHSIGPPDPWLLSPQQSQTCERNLSWPTNMETDGGPPEEFSSPAPASLDDEWEGDISGGSETMHWDGSMPKWLPPTPKACYPWTVRILGPDECAELCETGLACSGTPVPICCTDEEAAALEQHLTPIIRGEAGGALFFVQPESPADRKLSSLFKGGGAKYCLPKEAVKVLRTTGGPKVGGKSHVYRNTRFQPEHQGQQVSNLTGKDEVLGKWPTVGRCLCQVLCVTGDTAAALVQGMNEAPPPSESFEFVDSMLDSPDPDRLEFEEACLTLREVVDDPRVTALYPGLTRAYKTMWQEAKRRRVDRGCLYAADESSEVIRSRAVEQARAELTASVEALPVHVQAALTALVKTGSEHTKQESRDRLLKALLTAPTHSVLAVMCDTVSDAPLMLDQEEEAIAQAVQTSEAALIELRVLRNPNKNSFWDHLALNRYSIVLFSGHCKGAALYFGGDTPERLTIVDLMDRLEQEQPELEALVINSCGNANLADTLRKIMAQDGVPKHLIFSRTPVSDASALEFSKGLFRALAGGASIPVSFQQGLARRKAFSPVRDGDQEDHSFVHGEPPVIFQRHGTHAHGTAGARVTGNQPLWERQILEKVQAAMQGYSKPGSGCSGPEKVTMRPYQQEGHDNAVRANCILNYPTGSGKTLVASRVAESFTLQFPRKIAIMVVDRINLVFQQANAIEATTDLDVGRFCGLATQQQHWEDVFQLLQHDVVVITAGLLLNLLADFPEIVELSACSLLIFDECHHATKNHPYNVIMRDFYFPLEQRDRPRILGLTASPGSDLDVQKTFDTILELCSNLDAEIMTARETAVSLQPYMSQPNPVLIPVTYTDRECRTQEMLEHHLKSAVKGLLGDLESAFQKLKPTKHPEDLSCACGLLHDAITTAAHAGRKVDCFIFEHALDCILAFDTLHDLGENRALVSLKESIERLEEKWPKVNIQGTDASAATKLQSMLDAPLISSIRGNNLAGVREIVSGPRTDALVECLSDHLDTAKPRVIVFVQRREEAHLLSDFLNTCPRLGERCRATPLVGHGYGTVTNGMGFKQQQIAINRFKHDECNVLVSTNVGEEGLDITDCSAVMSFQRITDLTVTAFIQQNGRLLHNHDTANPDSGFIFFSLDPVEDRKALELIKIQHDNMTGIVHMLMDGGDWSLDELTGKHQYNTPYDMLQAKLQTLRDAQRQFLTVDAKDLLERYCQREASASPTYKVSQTGGLANQYTGVVTLPVGCGLKDGIGESSYTRENACISAAYKTCVELHGLGRLQGLQGSEFAMRCGSSSSGIVKTPLQALNEYATQRQWQLVWETNGEGPDHCKTFTAALSWAHAPDVYVAVAEASTLKEAKQRAAEELLAEDPSYSQTTQNTTAACGTPTKTPLQMLNEYAAQRRLQPVWETRDEGPPHRKTFTALLFWRHDPEVCVAVGEGSTLKEAKQRAAEELLAGVSSDSLDVEGPVATTPPFGGQGPAASCTVAGKSSLQVLNEYATQRQWQPVWSTSDEGSPHCKTFTAALSWAHDSDAIVAVAEGSTLKEAKQRAAEELLSGDLACASGPLSEPRRGVQPQGPAALGNTAGKSSLQVLNEYATQRQWQPAWETSDEGPPHCKTFTAALFWAHAPQVCVAVGNGSTLKEAKQRAAEELLSGDSCTSKPQAVGPQSERSQPPVGVRQVGVRRTLSDDGRLLRAPEIANASQAAAAPAAAAATSPASDGGLDAVWRSCCPRVPQEQFHEVLFDEGYCTLEDLQSMEGDEFEQVFVVILKLKPPELRKLRAKFSEWIVV